METIWRQSCSRSPAPPQQLTYSAWGLPCTSVQQVSGHTVSLVMQLNDCIRYECLHASLHVLE